MLHAQPGHVHEGSARLPYSLLQCCYDAQSHARTCLFVLALLLPLPYAHAMHVERSSLL